MLSHKQAQTALSQGVQHSHSVDPLVVSNLSSALIADISNYASIGEMSTEPLYLHDYVTKQWKLTNKLAEGHSLKRPTVYHLFHHLQRDLEEAGYQVSFIQPAGTPEGMRVAGEKFVVSWASAVPDADFEAREEERDPT